MLTLLIVGTLAGCSGTTNSPDVSDSIRKSLDQAGFKDVSVSQDRDERVVTLGGHVPSDGEKSQAESIAKSIAGRQVVSNQIGVIPPAAESEAKIVIRIWTKVSRKIWTLLSSSTGSTTVLNTT
jgi:osmotically-inducible protein OsmY